MHGTNQSLLTFQPCECEAITSLSSYKVEKASHFTKRNKMKPQANELVWALGVSSVKLQ